MIDQREGVIAQFRGDASTATLINVYGRVKDSSAEPASINVPAGYQFVCFGFEVTVDAEATVQVFRGTDTTASVGECLFDLRMTVGAIVNLARPFAFTPAAKPRIKSNTADTVRVTLHGNILPVGG